MRHLRRYGGYVGAVLAVLLAAAPAAYSVGDSGSSSGGSSGGSGSSSPPPPPDPNWVAYGFARAGHPTHGFGMAPIDNKSLLGLSAKGNIVVGDYTSTEFQDGVVTTIDGIQDADAVSRPYVIDESDAALGYQSGTTAGGLPYFNGNYDAQDQQRDPQTGELVPGVKRDGSPRKFYESTLSDAEFQALLGSEFTNPGAIPATQVQAALFTNHAIAGLVSTPSLTLIGSLVGRDEALLYNEKFYLAHDSRLLGPLSGAAQGEQFFLPVGLRRPTLIRWTESASASPTPVVSRTPPQPPTCPSGECWNVSSQQCEPCKVICTALYRQGLLPQDWWAADERFARTVVDAATLQVYRRWAKPIARLMERSRVAAAIAKPLALAWAQHMAYAMGAAPADSRLGRWLTRWGLSVHRWLGRMRPGRAGER